MLGIIFLNFNWIFNLVGLHHLWYDEMAGFAITMYPPMATSYDLVFNEGFWPDDMNRDLSFKIVPLQTAWDWIVE